MKYLGPGKYYLGIQVNIDTVYCLNQQTYIENLLPEFKMAAAKTYKIPVDPGYWKQINEVLLLPIKNYRAAIGKLLYLSVKEKRL